ncbi:MAG: DUF4838 domain-containing protein, partial [Ruminococcaceae bacterium]|nr:DUF4838 domain-containing protein [Oscillospiraceae bacterium]
MYRINKITSSHVVDFAAEELKKYLRMMMPRCGEIEIEYAPEAKEGFRLGLMQDLGLDVSEAPDVELDDILHIDTDEKGGIIAGDNPRSVLFAAYEFLKINGCRWLYPGIDGEYIPIRDIEPVKYHKMADNRFRGWCNEGAEVQYDMLLAIDFAAKQNMNIFMQEFDIPKAYYDNFYNHQANEKNREPEPINKEIVLQWKRQCEAEISKRGLEYHDMGHGWTAESFGISSANGWKREYDNPIPEGSKDIVALVGGKRDLWEGIALNTNFCMSNERARKMMVDYVVDYAELNNNVDYLHVWLSDGCNNHCECPECQKLIPSDYYVILLNELDEALEKKGLDTRIVFCCYYDTVYPPETVTLNNPKRFSVLLGAITRSYMEAVSKEDIKGYELDKYKRNENVFPKSIDEYVAYAKEWKRRCGGVDVFVYEYHFWIHQYREMNPIRYAELINKDIIGYHAHGFSGIVEDGSQRSFFPCGFPLYTYAATLFDTKVDFEELKEDYFSHIYGEDWREVEGFFRKLNTVFDTYANAGMKSADMRVGKFYCPEAARKL